MNPFLTLKVIFVCLFLFWWGYLFCKSWQKKMDEPTLFEAFVGIMTFIGHVVAFTMVLASIIHIFVIAYHAAPQ